MSQAGSLNSSGGGGGTADIQKINVQTGTSPVVTTNNTITFNGAVVAAGSNPVRTDGTAPATMALEVQTAQAIASTDATKIGLASFNSADFTVDANGFVSSTSSGGSFSLSPYICGPTGDTNAQFTGDTAIAAALAQVVTDAPTNATIFIKQGSYASGGFTVPSLVSGNPITFIGETVPPGTLQDNSGIGSNLHPLVIFTGPVTGSATCGMQFIEFQGTYTASQPTQFQWCSFRSGGSFTVSGNSRCQFTDCYIGGAVSSASTHFLLASFDRCQIDANVHTVSSGGDIFLFNDCFFTSNSSIVNTAASTPVMHAYNCRVNSSTWVDESNATNAFAGMSLDNIYLNPGSFAFRLKPRVNWSDITNITFLGSFATFIDDTAGTGSNTITISNSSLNGFAPLLNLSNNDNITIKDSIFVTGTGITTGTNTNITLINCNTFGSTPPFSLGAGSTFTNSVVSAPLDSSDATAAGGLASIAISSATQNNQNYDALVTISVEITASTGGNLVMGVGPSNPPNTNPVTVPLTGASTVYLSAYVPYQYYLLIDVSGTITTGAITSVVMPI